MKRTLIIETISCILVIVFMYAAFSKLNSYSTFKLQLSNVSFTTALAPVAWVLPAMEIAVSCLLLFHNTRVYGFYVSLFLLAAFIIYIALMLGFGKDLPCSCGGILKNLSWKQHLLFNASLLLVTFIGIIQEIKRKTELLYE